MKDKKNSESYGWVYTKNIFRMMLLASIIISTAVILTGILGYNTTKNSLIHKAKMQDIVFIVKSMASKIDGRIERAVETSYTFAKDPLNMEWVRGGEQDKQLEKIVLARMENIAQSYDYSNLFLVGAKTSHYYFREKLPQEMETEEWHADSQAAEDAVVLSKKNIADRWFYETLAAKEALQLNVNYDRAMDNYFLFVNVIMGNVEDPLGVCGVGLKLNDIVDEFSHFKVGKQSNLWVIDEHGIIQLSDDKEDIGKTYREFVPKNIFDENQAETIEIEEGLDVSQYTDDSNQIIDYAYCTLSSTDWILFYKIPRKENIAIINSLGLNMIVTVILVLACFVILFYMLSKKVANPYKQTMLINKELEEQVSIRTQELKESNQKIIDSIEYAKRLQETILPSQLDMKNAFKDHFVIWQPRDRVGGDFFWLREIDDKIILAVGDCTGHGVPGALMTMTVNAILHHIVTTLNHDDPSFILKELHRRLKETLNKTSSSDMMDDGLDIAIFCIKDQSTLLYAGANIEVYIKNNSGITILKPQTKGVGYSYIDIKEMLDNERVEIQEDDVFIVTTDGFIHQNGGVKNYPFGKKRLYHMIEESQTVDFSSMKDVFKLTLERYMQNEQQRDDITIVAFKVK